MPSKDLNFQNFDVAQSDQQPFPATIIDDNIIAGVFTPVSRLTFITGPVTISNIVPPTSGYCEVAIVALVDTVTLDKDAEGSNIAADTNLTTATSALFGYDPSSAKWYRIGAT